MESMSAVVKKEIVDNPDAAAAGNSDVEEDRFLYVYFHGSPDDVLIEEDGRVSFEDITLIDSISVGLYIQNVAIRRLLKPMNGYFEEPKEKWESFQVFAVSSTQFEIILKERVANADESLQNDADTVIETESSADHESSSNHQSFDSNRPSSSSLASASDTVVGIEKAIKTEANSFDTAINHESGDLSDVHIPPITVERDNSSQNSSFSIDIKRSSDVSWVLPKYAFSKRSKKLLAIRATVNSVTVPFRPTIKDVFAAYKVKTLNQLKLMLCRGDPIYFGTFHRVTNSFTQIMIAIPNMEIVRTFHWASQSKILLKSFDPTAKEKCEICNVRKNNWSFAHILSRHHIFEYRTRFNANPPEIAKLFESEIYMKSVKAKRLASLKFAEYKEMEESPEFSTDGLSSRFTLEAFKYKYSLIRQILLRNMTLNYKETFAVKKLLCLKNHLPELMEYFEGVKKCKICKNERIKTDAEAILHILSPEHFEKALNQKELDFICKSLSSIEPEIPSRRNKKRKKRRQQIPHDSEIESKRIKMD